MLFFQNDFYATTKTIKGIQYVVFSCYSGNETVIDRIETMIQTAFDMGDIDEITNESLCKEDIAIDGGV